MTEVRPDGQLEDKSIGELVKVATESVSRLIKSEFQLAKIEVVGDAKRGLISSGAFIVAAFVFGGFVLMASFSAAYGVRAIWGFSLWLSFLIVAILYLLLAVLIVGAGVLLIKRMTGPKRTRRTVKDDIAMLRRTGDDGEQPALTE